MWVNVIITRGVGVGWGGECSLECLHPQKTQKLYKGQRRILTYLFIYFICVRDNAIESIKNCFGQKSTSVTDVFFIQCHLLVQTILSMKIMYQPECLPYHQRVVLELTTQKDNQHSIHGEYSGLFLLFFPIVDWRFQRNLEYTF